MRQVIVVTQNGGLHGLEHKGRCIDLKKFGKALVERITLIEWDSDVAGWYIKWCNPMLGSLWSLKELSDIQSLHTATLKIPVDRSAPVYFHRYEDAVNAEVEVIQRLQKIGAL